MKELSPKQQQIYDFIVAFQARHGYPPSVREIGEHVGLKSPSTVHFHLKGMEEKGIITKAEGKTRAITVSGARPVAEELDGQADRVPVVGNVAAGSPILAQECIEDYLTFDTQGLSGEHFALRVRGDSMIGARIRDGDLVFIRRQDDVDDGQIAAVIVDDSATLKRVYHVPNGLQLLSENSKYPPMLFTCPDCDSIRILGLAVGFQSRLP